LAMADWMSATARSRAALPPPVLGGVVVGVVVGVVGEVGCPAWGGVVVASPVPAPKTWSRASWRVAP
jgi:hypothetical protein